MSDARTLGARLRQMRQLVGLTQRQLAARVGMTQATISGYERGTTVGPDPPRLHRLAQTLGVSPLWLLTGKEDACGP